MSYIEDFSKLHITFKSTVIGIAQLMPFWFVAFYLLNKNFVTTNELYTVLFFVFCLSYTTLFLWILVFFVGILQLSTKKITKEEVNWILFVSVIGISIVLSLCIYMTYQVLSLRDFIVYFHLLGLILGLTILIVDKFTHKADNLIK